MGTNAGIAGGGDDVLGSSAEVDELFDALSDRRRHLILSVLIDHQSPLTERELATRVAARARRQPIRSVSPEDRLDVQVTLHHNHLPKLEQAGLIDVNPEDRTITMAQNTIYERRAFLELLRR